MQAVDYFGNFCDNGNCKPNSPYRCEYPLIKEVNASIIKGSIPTGEITQGLIQIEANDKFRRYIEGTWTVQLTINNKIVLNFEQDAYDYRDWISYTIPTDELSELNKINWSDIINLKCKLLINNEIACPLSIDVVLAYS